MHALYLLLLLPILPAVGWAIHSKAQEHQYKEITMLAIPAVVILVNAVLVQEMMHHGPSLLLRFSSMLLCSFIIPLAYMYFTRQLGRHASRGTVVLLWVFLVDVFLPNHVTFAPGETAFLDPALVRPLSIQYVRDGQIVYSILTGDFVVIVQALIVMLRMIPFTRVLRQNGLKFNSRIFIFVAWSVVAAAFLVSISMTTMDVLSTTWGSICYFTGTALLTSVAYIMIAKHLALHPIETVSGEVVPSVDEFVEHRHAMANTIRHMVEEQQVYVNSGYSTKDILAVLPTNRTDFSQLMLAEFGMDFSSYLMQHRLQHAERLLLSTELKLSDIAEQSGFADASHLSRLFKETYGMPPKQWKTQKSGSLA